jgi:phospholipase/lecithinase/hemolysin
VVKAATATAVQASVAALNSAITSAAKQLGPNVIVYDLQAFFAGVRQNGLTAGANTLTADYLGGFYSLDGYYPGQTGHAAIANNLLQLLNSTYGTNFATVDLATVAAGDPVLGFTPRAKKGKR